MTDYNDGEWHGWNGGECPVHPQSVVEGVYTRSVAFTGVTTDIAKSFSWDHGENGLGLVAFRVVKVHREPREFWLSKHNHNYILAHKPESNDPKEFIHVREVIE